MRIADAQIAYLLCVFRSDESKKKKKLCRSVSNKTVYCVSIEIKIGIFHMIGRLYFTHFLIMIFFRFYNFFFNLNLKQNIQGQSPEYLKSIENKRYYKIYIFNVLNYNNSVLQFIILLVKIHLLMQSSKMKQTKKCKQMKQIEKIK